MGFGWFRPGKLLARNVTFIGADDFFQEPVLAHVEKTWRQWLAPLVPDLPPFKTVISELRPQVELLLSAHR